MLFSRKAVAYPGFPRERQPPRGMTNFEEILARGGISCTSIDPSLKSVVVIPDSV